MKNARPSYLILLLFVLSLIACRKNQNNNENDPIQLGAIYNLSGPQADLDIPSSRGAQLAIAELNAAGGIMGRELELILKDGASNAQTVAQKVQEMLTEAPEMPAIFGLSDTDLTLAAAPVAKAAGRVFLTSGATSPLLPAEVPDYLFLTCFGDNVQAAAAAEWAYNEIQARTVAVLYDSTETYTLLLQRYFIDRFELLGGQILTAQGYDPTDISGLGQGLPAADLVFLSAEVAQQALPVIQQLRQMGITSPILGGDGYDSEKAWEDNPDLTNVYYATHAYLGPDNPSERVRDFREAYSQTYGGNLPDSFAALGYDTVKLLAAAIAQAGSTDPDAVRQALGRLKDIPGVTGTISFSDGHQIPRKSVTMMEVKEGNRIFLREIIPEVFPNP